MPYNALVYKVLISCPGDVQEGRNVAREVIEEWNTAHGESAGKSLQPVDWKKDAVPSTGGRPQKLLNEQIVDSSDLLVAIFWTRAGTPTGEAISGTVEEIDRHTAAGKPTMLYFLRTPTDPLGTDQEQIRRLKDIKKQYEKKALVWEVDSPDKFRQDFSRHLASKMNKDAYFQPSASNTDAPLQPLADQESLTLSEEATALLLQATAEDGGGNIMKLMMRAGLVVKAGEKEFFASRDQRGMAVWRGAINELYENGLIEDAGGKGEIFRILLPGFELADSIRATTEPGKGRLATSDKGTLPSPELLRVVVQAFGHQHGKASVFVRCKVDVFLEFSAATELAIPHHKCDLSFKVGDTCFELQGLQVLSEYEEGIRKAAHTAHLPRSGRVTMEASAEGVQFPSDHSTADAVLSFQLGFAGCRELLTQEVILTRVEPEPSEWARWVSPQD